MAQKELTFAQVFADPGGAWLHRILVEARDLREHANDLVASAEDALRIHLAAREKAGG